MIKRLSILIISFGVYSNISASIYSQERTMSFDSSYLLDPTSNRAISNFGVEFFEAHDCLFDLVDEYVLPDHPFSRGLFLVGDMAFTTYLSLVFYFPYHELGHYNAFYAVGMKPCFIDRPNNFFGFFIEKFAEPYEGEATGAYGPIPTVNDDITIFAAGVNNEMRFSGDLADQAYYNCGHMGDYVPYVIGKLSSATYPADKESMGNDMTGMVQDYKLKGLDISKDDIDRSNYIAFFLSGSTYMYAKGIWDYIFCGCAEVNAFEYYNIRLPDVESYMNPNGISYKIKSGYRLNQEWLFPVAFEFIAKGDSQYEVTLGVRKYFPQMYDLLAGGNIVIGDGGMQGNVFSSLRLNRWMMVTVGLDIYNRKTLDGNRNIVTASSTANVASELWGRISFVY